MISLIKTPLRVYLILGTLALLGLFSGWKLPISLFPNSSKVTVQVSIPLYSMTPSDFFDQYGYNIETQLRTIDLKINNFTADYSFGSIKFRLDFDWSVHGDEALSKVRETMSGLSASFPENIRRGYYVHKWSENQTFLALSFFSETKTTDEIYNLLQPTLEPELQSIKEVQQAFLYNPQRKEIMIELIPEKMAQFNLQPQDVESFLRSSIREYQGGRIEYQEKKMQIFFDRQIKTSIDLENFSFYTTTKQIVFLKDIANIKIGVSENSQNVFRTSGSESLILFAEPKAGANVKIMSENIIKVVLDRQAFWPKDIQFKYLVNPADFINSSVKHLAMEVAIAAFLAVFILFVFIGSFKNVITAAIEIPLSIIMAFILMKLFDMNINLISLGGLALSAGMNVDASVVVIENIFRHFKLTPHLSKLENIVAAVQEVYKPILVSTLASLIVFFPIIFTTGLTNSILGDLAKAVIFSHGLSAIVALVLVPTVRLHLSSWFDEDMESPIEKYIHKLELFYEKTLIQFINSKFKVTLTSLVVVVLLLVMVFYALPKLPKEIIGKPETDWLMLFPSSKDWQSVNDMDEGTAQIDAQIREKYGDKILYTFSEAGRGWCQLMVRLKNKNDLLALKEAIEADYPDSPNLKVNVDFWNPSELSIPNPPDFKVNIIGSDDKENQKVADLIYNQLLDLKVFSSTSIYPESEPSEALFINTIRPQYDSQLISNYINLSSEGHYIFDVVDPTSHKKINVSIQSPKKYTHSIQNLKSMPYPHMEKIVPLSAAGVFNFQPEPKGFLRENGVKLISISGRVKSTDPKKDMVQQAQNLVKKIQQEQKPESTTGIEIKNASEELDNSINQLLYAIGLSIGLIFILMVLLFGTWIDGFLILLAIPFGILGTLISLTIFKSNLSLNSALGVILLNGISVANSIILVDFMKELKRRGLSPKEAAIQAAKARLRPILMTSLTTVLGMLPIAFGLGAGGKILQPLGISVAGGLWVSMIFTLYFVPTLQTYYDEWKGK
jgi:HAE1 family hydrophobic/amphiphilic exporter-1